jgi:hypothetical protein
MRGGAPDSFFEERLAMRERGPSYGWYVLPVVAAVLVAAAVMIVVAGRTWSAVGRPGTSWLPLAGAILVLAVSIGALTGARRRMRYLLGTSAALGLAGLAIVIVPPTTLTYQQGLLWYKDRIGQDAVQQIVGSAPAATGRSMRLDTLLGEYYKALAGATEPEIAVVVEGFLYRDAAEEEISFHAPPEEGAEGEMTTERQYQPSKGFKLGRFCAWETLGDAGWISIDVSYPDIRRRNIQYGTWVRVTGVVTPTIYVKRTIPILWATKVEPLKRPPAQPYVWYRAPSSS